MQIQDLGNFRRKHDIEVTYFPTVALYHCYIVDHEDNEMVRPDRVTKAPIDFVVLGTPKFGIGARAYQMGTDYWDPERGGCHKWQPPLNILMTRDITH